MCVCVCVCAETQKKETAIKNTKIEKSLLLVLLLLLLLLLSSRQTAELLSTAQLFLPSLGPGAPEKGKVW